MLRSKVFAAVVFATFICCSPARAQTDFPAGTTTLSLGGSYTMPIRYSEGGMYAVHGTIGKYLWDNHSFNLELSGQYFDQPSGNEDVWIGAVGLLGRLHFLNFDRWSIFFDGGGGVSYGDDAFPTERFRGTHFNLYGKVGLGASYELRDREYLTGGVRYIHFSNGQIHGQDQNPGYDGLQYWVGMMWTK